MKIEIAPVVDLPTAAVYKQEFAIRYDYPVYFTEGVFDRDNPIFEEALCRREPRKRHRFAAFIDANTFAVAVSSSCCSRAYASATSFQYPGGVGVPLP